ncbi:MAG: helix-turn-helix transcriptional regulator [Clostridia bacterium]|nr:helix-turn-helix transcriptional regulator [Clostridia bacterium]MBO7407742.1 helix-turn-helix transcriptional regulator [Clostridia bacterium]MBP5730296.1 helix-turn-helix transcriptional regulator [Clostridia bacterium]
MIRFESNVYTHYIAKKETPCTIDFLSASLLEFERKTKINQTFLNNYQLIYLSNGKLDLIIDGETVGLTAGNLAIVSPFTTYSGIANPSISADNTGTAFYIAEFSCSNFIFFPLEKYAVFKGANAAESPLAELYSKHVRGEADTYICDVLMLETIYVAERLAKETTPQQQLATKVRDYILQNLMKPLTAESLAADFCYNKDYLGRVFKAEFGQTVKDYINGRKLALAKKLLTTSDMPVSAVGQFLGWSDLNQFLKYFKYHEGMTPAQYRKSVL